MTADHIAVPAEWLKPGAVVPVTPEAINTLVQALRAAQAPAEGAEPDDLVERVMRSAETLTMAVHFKQPKTAQDRARANLRATVQAVLAANVQPKGIAPTAEQAAEMGRTGAQPTEAERLLFEAWMRGHCWKIGGEWNGKQYVDPAESDGYPRPQAMLTRQLFAAWRDRAALAAQAPAPAPEPAEKLARRLRFEAWGSGPRCMLSIERDPAGAYKDQSTRELYHCLCIGGRASDDANIPDWVISEPSPAVQDGAEVALAHIAALAHEGGLAKLNEGGALSHIRRLCLPYWDDKGNHAQQTHRVQAAIDAALGKSQPPVQHKEQSNG